jgi:HD-like signal output (HDOD) protein
MHRFAAACSVSTQDQRITTAESGFCRWCKVATSNDLRALALRAADCLPRLSVGLNRALGLFAQGDDVRVQDLGAVIEDDPVVTGSLLSIANSAFYRRNGGVSSVRLAIARLGVCKTRNVLVALTVSRWFNAAHAPEPWSSIRFNAHALAVATLSDLIARNVPSGNSEWAFVAGLLHEIGLPLIAIGLPEQYRAITMDATSDVQIVEREREVLGFTHFDIGADILDRWNCPMVVQEATRFCERTGFPYEQPLELGAAVNSANLLADANGISIFDSSEDPSLATELLDALKILAPVEFIATFRMEYGALQASAS